MRRRIFHLLALGFLMVAPAIAAAQQKEPTFTTIDPPDSDGSFTNPLDINDSGEIVGLYNSAPDGARHGFLRSKNGDYTRIDFPGSTATHSNAINENGDIVGHALVGGKRHGYLRKKSGEFVQIDFPGAAATLAFGINTRGDIVGRYCLSASQPCKNGEKNAHGFLLREGKFMTIDFPGALETHAYKINPSGQIVGSYLGPEGRSHLFLLGDSEFRTIDFPGAFETPTDGGQAGINANGEIVSFYCAAAPLPCEDRNVHGFAMQNGAFTLIDVPNAVGTGATGINSRGDIVGFYNPSHSLGFLRTTGEAADAGSLVLTAVANDVAVLASDPAVAYAATDAGLFKTESGGRTWQKIREGRSVSVALCPAQHNTAYLSQCSSACEIERTTDGGTTWTGIRPDLASVLGLAPSDPSTMYAALLSNGMSKSIDGGTTWSTIMSNLPTAFFYFYASSIAVDPADSSTVYLGQDLGLFKTINGGANWTQINQSATNLPAAGNAVAMDTSNPSTVYFGANGVMKSTDAGQTWTAAGLADKIVFSFVLSKTSPAILYAGTKDGQLYRSTDAGGHWATIDGGTTRGPVIRLSVDPSGNHLYAATATGVYEYDFGHDNLPIERLTDNPLRLPRMLDQLLAAAPTSNAAFALPVVGSATGVGGTIFTTGVMLTNDRAMEQDVLLAWLPQANTGVAPMFRVKLPPASPDSSGTLNIVDAANRFAMSGLGSLVVFAIDGSDHLDAGASIGGTLHVWVQPVDRCAPFPQSIPGTRAALFSEHSRMTAIGFEQDPAFRTNIGIVNFSGEPLEFSIEVSGERASRQFNLTVPPFSLMQAPLPNADYGALSLVVSTDTPTQWLLYGSTINNQTGGTRTAIGIVRDP